MTPTTQEASHTQSTTQVTSDGADIIVGSGVRSIVVEAAEVQAAMQPWVDMECYQLGEGKRVSQMDILDVGSQRVVRECQEVAVQKLGITPSNFCTVSYCTLDPTFRFTELFTGDDDTLFFMPGNTEYDIYVPAGTHTGYISFNQDEFLTGARALNPADWEHTPSQVLALHTRQQVNFRTVVEECLKVTETFSILGEVVDRSMVQGMLLQHILHLAVSSGANLSSPPPMERARAYRICTMARTLVEERLAVDILPTIVDICTTLGVSERTLQYAFRAYVNMSPLVYLRMCRLNRVRETLLASDPGNTTVTAIAMRYGFLHLGRFAIDYKQVFEEHPSATLAS